MSTASLTVTIDVGCSVGGVFQALIWSHKSQRVFFNVKCRLVVSIHWSTGFRTQEREIGIRAMFEGVRTDDQ